MKLFVLFAIIGLSVAANIQLDEDVLGADYEDVQSHGFVTRKGSQVILDKLAKQMPWGWPEYGIPPLAPLTINELRLSNDKYQLSTNTEITNLTVNGLDNFKVKDAKINIFKKKMNFDLTFPVLTISADKYNTINVIDALEELGVRVQLVAAGGLELTLENVRVQGRVRYSKPLLWGSYKVTSWDTYVTIEQSSANFENLLGNGKLNKFVNRLIGEQIKIVVLKFEDEISTGAAELLIPRVNKALKGSLLWKFIKIFFGI